MVDFTHELRLVGFTLVNAVVLASAWCATGRLTARHGRAMRVVDTLVLWYLVQYLAVCAAGVLHVLGVTSVYAIAVALAAALVGIARLLRSPEDASPIAVADEPPVDRWLVPAIALLAGGFAIAFAWHQRYQPIFATDPLVYHMPTAIHWIQQRSLALYDVWFWMPANTYSPLAGTAFTVWLFGPIGNDVLARGVQLPTLAILFASVYAIGRSLGSSGTLAALVACAAVLSRPFLSQVLTPKDDLFVCAFFLAAVASLDPARLRERAAPWRVGVLVGLLLATKYTVLLTVPVLLLAIDAPWRAGWRGRQWLTAVAVAFALAAPWYARNWVVTGNPLFPVDLTIGGVRVFTGLFTPDRSDTLKSVTGVWGMLSQTYHSMPVAVLGPLLAMVLVAIGLSVRRMRRDPLLRLVLLGPIVGLALFVAKSPHAEVRYMFPLFLLLFTGAGVMIATVARRPWLRAVTGGLVLAASIGTTLRFSNIDATLAFTATGLAAALAGAAVMALHRFVPARRLAVGGAAALAVVLGFWVYVDWRAYVEGYRDTSVDSWRVQFGATADAWGFVRDTLPPDSPLAVANAYNVYPLYGFDASRRVVYAPSRSGVHHLADLPRLADGIKADDVIRTISVVTNTGVDRDTWLANLRATGAAFLYVAKTEATDDAPELRFARADPAVFEPVFDNPAATVFRIRRPDGAQ